MFDPYAYCIWGLNFFLFLNCIKEKPFQQQYSVETALL